MQPDGKKLAKQGPGRPRIDRTKVLVSLPLPELARLDTWIATQPAPLTRPEAIRRLLERALAM